MAPPASFIVRGVTFSAATTTRPLKPAAPVRRSIHPSSPSPFRTSNPAASSVRKSFGRGS